MDSRRSDPRRPRDIISVLETLEKAIEQRLASHAGEPFGAAHDRPFAVFDFDNTCIINDIGEATFAYLCGHGLLRDRKLLGEEDNSPEYHARVFRTYHGLLEQKKHRAAYMLCARTFSGFTPGEAEAAALAAITEEGVRIGSKIVYDVHIERGLAPKRKTLELMEFLRKKGVRIWIVSASAEPAVRAAARHFGVEAEVLGVRCARKDNMFTSELEEPIPMFEGKAKCIRTYIDSTRAPLLAVGDSMNDLPMLEAAHIQVAVDRKNELTHLAHTQGWFVL